MIKPTLKIGFDLDGVLLYNPARIVRPIIVRFKKIFLPAEVNKFHLPKTSFQKLIWNFLHKSSFMAADGIDDIKMLVNEKKIEAFIVSARYDSLKEDFNKWLKILEARKYFAGIYYNDDDEQPQYFKEKMIKKLKLDVFVEDNWDIVKYLNFKFKISNLKLLWIYNFLDRNINYQLKFSSLKNMMLYIISCLDKQ